MTSRQRVLTTVRHEEPDRVPCNLRLEQSLAQVVCAELSVDDLPEHFGHDIRYVGLQLPRLPEGLAPADWTPLPTEADIATVAEATRALHDRGLAVCGAYACGVYEQAKAWLGDEATMTGPYDDPLGFGETLDRITEWKCAVYGAYAAAGTDIVWIGDDLGTQRSLVMSPEQYREWYRPHHLRIVEHIRSIRPDAIVAFHCCGHVTPLIPDLIEVGINVLEAVQPETMDIAALKREFGRDLTFWGAVGAQSVLARTTPAQVTAGVRETLRIMAPGGGFIASACHTLTEEVPVASVIAFHEAVAEYGAYPEPG